jgi:hypothetical protein
VSPAGPPEHEIDALVGAHLRRQAETVDAGALLARVRAGASPARTLRLPRPGRRARWAVLTAAGLLAAFLAGQYLGPAQAGAETLVREAREAHALPLDRCYLVQWVPAAGSLPARLPRLAQARETRLWTRGDRFWLESTDPGRRWAWGRDDRGAVWLALGRGHGLRYEPGEVPEPVAAACDVCGMRVETLLGDVLADFDLRREPPGPGSTAYRVRAEPKPGRAHPALRSALLEVDAETRVLRRLVLERTRRGKPLASVTFTLVESGARPDGTYQLEGHLDPGAPVYSPANKQRQRAPLLRAFFGLPPGRPGDGAPDADG